MGVKKPGGFGKLPKKTSMVPVSSSSVFRSRPAGFGGGSGNAAPTPKVARARAAKRKIWNSFASKAGSENGRGLTLWSAPGHFQVLTPLEGELLFSLSRPCSSPANKQKNLMNNS